MEEVTGKSNYNEAGYKMQRLHEWQRAIAHVNPDLGVWYEELGVYGYQYKITMLENLVSEVWGKTSPDARKKINQYRKVIRAMKDLYPVFIESKLNSIEGTKNGKRLHKDNLLKIEELLFEFHMYINELLEEAGYSTFTLDTYEGDPFN